MKDTKHCSDTADEHDLGLQHDLMKMAPKVMARRQILSFLGAAGGAAVLSACGGDDDTSSTSTTNTDTGSDSGTDSGTDTDTDSDSGTDSSTCSVADPVETNGPYPGDGSNTVNGSTVNVLTESGVVRSDIRSSFGGMTGTAEGVEMVLNVTIVDVNNSCARLEGYALYIWHCDANGDYSLYSSGLQDENFLRGVQETDANGELTFTTIFPGCYEGRWPHIHFEVYSSLDEATHYNNRELVSQMALPADTSSTVYNNDSGYSNSVGPFSRITLASDNVFGDNTDAEVAVQTISIDSGNYVDGYEASITIGLAL